MTCHTCPDLTSLTIPQLNYLISLHRSYLSKICLHCSYLSHLSITQQSYLSHLSIPQLSNLSHLSTAQPLTCQHQSHLSGACLYDVHHLACLVFFHTMFLCLTSPNQPFSVLL